MNQMDEALEQVGLNRQTISNLEGLILISYLIDGRDESMRRWFSSVKSSLGDDSQIRQGLDKLDNALLEEPSTPYEIYDLIKRQVAMSRKPVYPGQVLRG